MSIVSSLHQSQIVRHMVRQTQTQIADLQRQISSGSKADSYADLGGRGTEASHALRGEVERRNGHLRSLSMMEMRAERAEAMLTDVAGKGASVRDAAYKLRTNLTTPEYVRREAESAFHLAVANFNTNLDGHYVFTGIQKGAPPIQASDDILDALRGRIDDFLASAGPTITFDDLVQVVEGYFDATEDPDAPADAVPWADTGGPAEAIRISDGRKEAPPTSFSPQDPSDPVRSVLARLATLAVVDPADSRIASLMDYSDVTPPLADPAASTPEREAAFRAKYIDFAEGQSDALAAAIDGSASRQGLRDMIAENGRYRSTLSAEIDSQKRLKLAAETALGDLEGVDTAEALLRLTELQTRLQASYQLVGELRRLSLTQFL